jgi:hypothetical protein
MKNGQNRDRRACHEKAGDGVCNLDHSVDQRACRFLSHAFDCVNGDEIVMTHERMGRLLGGTTRRSDRERGSTAAIGGMQYQRGRVRLVSRPALEARACVCSAIIRRAFAALSE